MPPHAPPADHNKACPPRQRHAAEKAPQRCASFHGRTTPEHHQNQQREHHHQLLLRQRPRTHPDLLAGVSRDDRGFRRAGGTVGAVPWGRRAAAPSKALVTVAVQRSMWPLHVMAGAEWRVADLVAAAVELYVRERRRPLLPSADPSEFGLHYSQFSLESLDPEEKLMELGSRSFFLCPRATTTTAAVAAPATATRRRATEATTTTADRPNVLQTWLGFMHFWPLL